MYPQPGDEPQVQQDVGRRPHQRGPKGRRALFGDYIDAAHKVGEGRSGHGQGQHRDIPPRGVIGLVRQNADEQRRQGDDPARPQKDGGGKQGRVPPGPDEVGTESVIAGGDDEGGQQESIGPHLRYPLQQGDHQQHPRRAQGDHPQAHGEGPRPSAPAVRRKAEHRVGDIQRHQGDQQICRLGDEVGGAVLRRGEIAGVKPHHQKHQQLRADGADAHQNGVGRQGLVFVHAPPTGQMRSPMINASLTRCHCNGRRKTRYKQLLNKV